MKTSLFLSNNMKSCSFLSNNVKTCLILPNNMKSGSFLPNNMKMCSFIIKQHESLVFSKQMKTCLFLPNNAFGNMSGYRCVFDCRSRGREFNPGPVPYFGGDWSWNNFYGHSPPFRWFIQEGLLSVTSESMCTNYWLTACLSLPRKKCG